MSNVTVDAKTGFILDSSSRSSASEASTDEAKSAAVEETAETAKADADESDPSEEQEEETGEGDSEDSDDERSDEEKSEDDRPKKKNGYKKRVEKLLSRERAALERAERLEQELRFVREQAGKGQSQNSEERAQSKAMSDDGAPDPENFDSVADYMRAVAKHELAQEKKAQEAKAKEEAARSEYENLTKTHQERLEKFKAETPDYLDVVQAAVADLGSDYRLNPALEMALKGSEYSAQMFYELAQRGADEIHRVNQLPYAQMIRELTRIEVSLEAQKEKPKTEIKKSSAPAPLSTVKAQGTGLKKSIYTAKSFAEYEALRKQELKQKQG